MSNYTPRVAIITGGAQGLGRSIALQLAKDGVDVAVNDLASKQELLSEVVREIQGIGRRGIAIPADVTSEDEVKGMIKRVADEMGSVDIMIANAGIARLSLLIETSVEELESVLAVNVRGVFLCYKHAAIQMIEEGHGGRIIGASSLAGKEGFTNAMSYCASKFAVRGITQTAAKELKASHITVNCYAPGFIRTPMTTIGPGTAEENLQSIKEKYESPQAEVGEPQSVASVVSFLCKPEAHFITGQSFNICGTTRVD
ncbi:NAD-binding protein [Schizopora paradoxa]|uniref:NAD-binding protein n=1 Tax=Schizopora paradoxa TaxID=27342 RepID=A0A0H2R254_9AGAM|nr:NAD-binding protein [Schizopora paradoxa]